MEVNFFPIERPDESLYSVVARIRLANAAKNDLDACRSLFGRWRNMHVSNFPVNLAHFCSITQNCFGDPDRVLQGMTLAKFFERVGSRPWRKGSHPGLIATAGYGLATLSNGAAGRWRICLQCRKSDLACHATSFWRRAHHLPTSLVCPVHGTALITALPPALELGKRLLLPEQVQGRTCVADVKDTHHEDLVRLTTLGVNILEDHHPLMKIEDMRAALLCALESRGLLTATRMLRRVQFAAEFAQRYHFLAQHPDFNFALSSKGIAILQRSLSQPGLPRSPVHNLLLLDWLFGTWQAFQQNCFWQSTMNDFTPPDKTPQQDTIRDWHRKICLEFLETQALATRSRFFRAAPVTFRWLLRYDDIWFNAYLPVLQRGGAQSTLF